MVALVQIFVDIIGIFFTFVQTYLVPDTASNINIIHVAVWTPVVIGLLALTASFIKGLWARRGRRA